MDTGRPTTNRYPMSSSSSSRSLAVPTVEPAPLRSSYVPPVVCSGERSRTGRRARDAPRRIPEHQFRSLPEGRRQSRPRGDPSAQSCGIGTVIDLPGLPGHSAAVQPQGTAFGPRSSSSANSHVPLRQPKARVRLVAGQPKTSPFSGSSDPAPEARQLLDRSRRVRRGVNRHGRGRKHRHTNGSRSAMASCRRGSRWRPLVEKRSRDDRLLTARTHRTPRWQQACRTARLA